MRAWEPEPKESSKAFAAFKVYRDLGSERTLKSTAESYYGSTSNLRQISTWSSRFDWVQRAKAYDAHQEMVRREAVEEYEQAFASEEARIQHEIRVQLLHNGRAAARRAGEIIESPMYTEREVRNEDGVIVAYIKEPTRWTFDTAKKMYEMGALAAGEVTSRTESRKIEEEIEHADNPAAAVAINAWLDATCGGPGVSDGPSATGRSELE